MKLSFVCNATSKDKSRLRHFLPAVLAVFDNYIDELIIVFETLPETGRIKKLHGDQTEIMEDADFYHFNNLDSRIKFIATDYTQLDVVSRKYFGIPGINRCQGGTPIFAFLYGLEQAKNDHIIRADCDMIFYDNGFITDAINRLPNYHFIIPPYIFRAKETDEFFTTRCFFMNRRTIHEVLPFIPRRLDLLRSLHRKILRRSSFLALEQMIEFNIEKYQKIKIFHQDVHLGNTMHVCTREEFSIPEIESIISSFIEGKIPKGQYLEGVNFEKSFWIRS